MLHLFIYAISIHCAIHGIQARSIQNDTLENRIVALEKLVENLYQKFVSHTVVHLALIEIQTHNISGDRH